MLHTECKQIIYVHLSSLPVSPQTSLQVFARLDPKCKTHTTSPHFSPVGVMIDPKKHRSDRREPDRQIRMTTLETRLSQIRARIRAAELRFHRQPGSVHLLAVSKTRTTSEIAACMDLGQTCFGENQLQEALDKITDLDSRRPEWHFIGHIQANKTTPIAERFAWVHSIDRLKIARRLNDQRPPDLQPLNVCIQVNVSEEPTKSGVKVAELPDLAAAMALLPMLRLRGLMCVPAPCEGPALQRRPFRKLRELQAELIRDGLALDTLSMGMTADIDAAIAEGTTMVRIGTAIFGPRRYPKSVIGLDPHG